MKNRISELYYITLCSKKYNENYKKMIFNIPNSRRKSCWLLCHFLLIAEKIHELMA